MVLLAAIQPDQPVDGDHRPVERTAAVLSRQIGRSLAALARERNDNLGTTNWMYQTNFLGNGSLMQVVV